MHLEPGLHRTLFEALQKDIQWILSMLLLSMMRFQFSLFLVGFCLSFIDCVFVKSNCRACEYELSGGQVSRRENEPSRTITVCICLSVYFSPTRACLSDINILRLKYRTFLFPGHNFLLLSISRPMSQEFCRSLLHLHFAHHLRPHIVPPKLLAVLHFFFPSNLPSLKFSSSVVESC